MSKATDLEIAIANVAKPLQSLPVDLPSWMKDLGIQSQDEVVTAKRVGAKSPTNKTDILIEFRNSPALKISAKLSNADYYGNWYGHQRFLKEFGEDTFKQLSDRVTAWANSWMYDENANLFVGVSISFGKRTGKTWIPFLDIFDNTDELIKVIAGYGQDDQDNRVANCLYISNYYPNNFADLINQLTPISSEIIEKQSHKIKIICRPVNPIKEKSNRYKNVYTQFQPYQPLPQATEVTSLAELRQLGKFKEVQPNRLNHNRILNYLASEYNIVIPRKQ